MLAQRVQAHRWWWVWRVRAWGLTAVLARTDAPAGYRRTVGFGASVIHHQGVGVAALARAEFARDRRTAPLGV
ncbi:hypothetical protein, partial [Mycobacterium persicum]|uniref:hypothetical protein n=1 Tax=Mycobacterium persicum TaxID=1487726 RepID=UPI001C7E3507